MIFGNRSWMTFVALLPLSVVFNTIDHWPWYPFGLTWGVRGGLHSSVVAHFLPANLIPMSVDWKWEIQLTALLCEVTQGSVWPMAPFQHVHDTTGWDHPSLCNEVSSLGWWHSIIHLCPRWSEWCYGCSFTVPGEYVDLDGIMTNSSHWFFTLFLHISNILFRPISLPI